VTNSGDRIAGLKDAAAGGILLVLAALYYWQSLKIQESSLSDEVGPQGLPFMLAGSLAAAAVLIGIRGLLAARKAAESAAAKTTEKPADHVATIPRALGFLAIGAGYMLIGPVVGYIVAIGLLIGAVAIYEGRKPSLGLVAVAACAGVGFWVVFVLLLGTEQPQGRFF
jgi:putative tricarboxylic transport membrane protein